jgi:hypothetical protein
MPSFVCRRRIRSDGFLFLIRARHRDRDFAMEGAYRGSSYRPFVSIRKRERALLAVLTLE